jgi:hypothetical protein
MARRDDSTSARSVVQAALRSDSTPSRARAEPVTRREIEARITAFVREVVKPGRWRVHVPGTHTGGITYELLLDVLASQGREFLSNTVQLSLAVSAALRREWLGSDTMPTERELEQTAEQPLLDHVEKRFSPGNGIFRSPRSRLAIARRSAGWGAAGSQSAWPPASCGALSLVTRTWSGCSDGLQRLDSRRC